MVVAAAGAVVACPLVVGVGTHAVALGGSTVPTPAWVVARLVAGAGTVVTVRRTSALDDDRRPSGGQSSRLR